MFSKKHLRKLFLLKIAQKSTLSRAFRTKKIPQKGILAFLHT
jgi:hypothetical protein